MSGYKSARGGSTASVTVTVYPADATGVGGSATIVVGVCPTLTQEVLGSGRARGIFTILSDDAGMIEAGMQVPSMEDSGPPSRR